MMSCVAAPIPVLRAPESPWREPLGITDTRPPNSRRARSSSRSLWSTTRITRSGSVLWPRIASIPWLSSPQRSSL